MKKYYEELKMEIIDLDPTDLILTSGGEESGEDNTPGGSNTPSGGGDYTDEGFSNYH